MSLVHEERAPKLGASACPAGTLWAWFGRVVALASLADPILRR